MMGSNVIFLIQWTVILNVNALKRHCENNLRTRLKTKSRVPNEYFSHNFNRTREFDNKAYKLTDLLTLPDCKVGRFGFVPRATAGITGLTVDCHQMKLQRNDFTTLEFYLYKNTFKPSKGLKRSCLNLEFACQGVLLHQGDRDLILNTAIPYIENLVVAIVLHDGLVDVINVDLSVMDKCDLPISVCRGKVFENLDTGIRDDDRTRTVGAVASVSDFLHERLITEGFEKLFLTINQLYVELLWCMHQTVSLLQSVMNDYIAVTGGKMNGYNCLEISKHLLMISKSIYDFFKSSKEENSPAMIENINIIKTIFQNCMKLLRENIYFDTKYDHFGLASNEVDDLVLQNVDDALMYYGLLSVLNNEDISENTDFDVNFHLLKLNPEDKNTVLFNGVSVGPAFMNELINEGDMWALYVYKINKEIWQLPESDSVQFQTQILSLNLVNMKDDMKKRSTKEFKNPIDMQLKLNEPFKAPIMNYTIQAPTNDSGKKTLDTEVLVFKVDMTNISTLFVTIGNMTDSLLFTWMRNTRPDIELMSNEKYTTELPVKEKHKFKLNTLSGYSNPVHYLGFYVKTKASTSTNNDTSSKNSTSSVRFTISIYSPQCLYWDGMDWITDRIVMLAMAIIRTFRLSVHSDSALTVSDMLAVTGGRFCVVVFCLAMLAIGAWTYSAGATVDGHDEYFNVFDGHPVLVSLFTVLFFNVAIIAIMIKYYAILETDST